MTVPGQRKRVTATLTAGGVNADGTVVATLQAPDGTETNPTVTHGATGVYTTEFTLNQEGPWFFRIVSSGAVVAAAELSLPVTDSPFFVPA